MADTNAEPTSGGGGGGSFSEERLIEKLGKLNSSAVSIQTLSNWCIFHRKRAKRVVDTWEKQFNIAIKEKKVSFLYLSNDILQNSRRKGLEFVNEFWRVLPGLMKVFYDDEDEDGKKVVARLIGIWDERKVFGSRSGSLKTILGANPPTMDSNRTSNPLLNSKAAQKDSSTIIKKLTVGGMPDKIVTAYQYVLDQHFNEDTTLSKCKTTMSVFKKMNKEVDAACTSDIQQASSLIYNIQEQEAILRQCIQQLESFDKAKITLINQLKQALHEQEIKSEHLRNQLQAARIEADHATQLKHRLGAHASNRPGSGSSTFMALPSEQTAAMIQNAAMKPISPQFQPPHPASSHHTTTSAADDEPKKTAAAIADKLASLSSPEQMFSSILVSLAAEQAASMHGGSTSGELSEGPPDFQMQKKTKLENPRQTGGMDIPGFFGKLPRVQQHIEPAPTSLGGAQPSTEANQPPGSFAPPPLSLPPGLPPLMPQFQIAGGMIGMGPFGMMSSSVPPSPPLPNMLPPGFPRPSGPPPPLPNMLPPGFPRPSLLRPPPSLAPAQNQSHPQQQSWQPAPQQSTTSGTGFFPPFQVQQSRPAQRQ